MYLQAFSIAINCRGKHRGTTRGASEGYAKVLHRRPGRRSTPSKPAADGFLVCIPLVAYLQIRMASGLSLTGAYKPYAQSVGNVAWCERSLDWSKLRGISSVRSQVRKSVVMALHRWTALQKLSRKGAKPTEALTGRRVGKAMQRPSVQIGAKRLDSSFLRTALICKTVEHCSALFDRVAARSARHV